jgi:ferredoxin
LTTGHVVAAHRRRIARMSQPLKTALHVTIDPDRCVGNGRCAALAPGFFMIDEDTNKAYYEEEALAATDSKTIFAAARGCPTQAIIIEQLGRRLYPVVLAPMPAEIQRQLREAADEAEGDDKVS